LPRAGSRSERRAATTALPQGGRCSPAEFGERRPLTGEPLPRLRRSSLRTETFSDSSAAPLVSSGPSRSRLPAGTRDSRKSRGEGCAQAPAGSRCLLLQPREVSGEVLPNEGIIRAVRAGTRCILDIRNLRGAAHVWESLRKGAVGTPSVTRLPVLDRRVRRGI